MAEVRPETAARVEQARLAHNAAAEAAKWWKPWLWTRTHETARTYRYALLAAAYEEMR